MQVAFWQWLSACSVRQLCCSLPVGDKPPATLCVGNAHGDCWSPEVRWLPDLCCAPEVRVRRGRDGGQRAVCQRQLDPLHLRGYRKHNGPSAAAATTQVLIHAACGLAHSATGHPHAEAHTTVGPT